jgi:SAM-dependent methyltransferase
MIQFRHASPTQQFAHTGEDIAPELLNELDANDWMYQWRLTPTVTTPQIGGTLEAVHRTRAEMIAPAVRAALAAAGPGASALDLACNEGWFSHRLLDWGAHRVVGVDVREHNIRRAAMLRHHFGIPEDRLQFVRADVLGLDPDELGRFDVVLMLGLIYHLERPLDAIRVAFRTTSRLCVIESQLTRQERPIVHGDGVPNHFMETPASFAAWMENDPDNALASTDGVMSLYPNRAALESMPRWAGFDSVEFLPAAAHHDSQYVLGDRAIVACSVVGDAR